MRNRSAARGLLAALLILCAQVAHADLHVTLAGVEDAARRNVLARLSIERYRDRDDIDEDTANRLFNRIDQEVKDALRPFGHYEPVVEADFRREGSDWHFDIRVQPGEPVRIRRLSISIIGPGEEDPVFDNVRTQTLIETNMRLNHGSYEEVKGEMIRAAAANGYLMARMVKSVMDVDVANRSAEVELQLDTGPRYSFGRIEIDQDVIRPGLMRRFLRFSEGQPYNASDLLRTQFALDDSLYFSTVDVQPEEPDHETLTVPVRVTATKSRWRLSVGAGYGTDTQIRGTLGWTNTRLNPNGHRLRFELKASASTRRVDARYDIPIGDPALEKLSAEFINKFNEDLADLDTNETTIRPSVTRVKNRWQSVTSLAFTRTTTDDGATRFTSNLVVPGYAVASVPKGFLGEELFTRAFYAELIGSHGKLGSDADFLRLNLQAERSFDFAFQWHLLLRGEFGTSVVGDFSEVPGIYRFFAGGDRSVRGFAYNSLSPELVIVNSSGELETRKIGGRHLVVGSAEIVRDLPLNLAVATFFDIGNAFNSLKDSLEYAAGVGIRYRLPVLSIGLDVAKPLSTSGGLRLHLNITPKL